MIEGKVCLGCKVKPWIRWIRPCYELVCHCLSEPLLGPRETQREFIRRRIEELGEDTSDLPLLSLKEAAELNSDLFGG